MNTVQEEPIGVPSLAALKRTGGEPPEEHVRRYLRFRGTSSGECIALEALEPGDAKHRFTPLLLAVTTTPKVVEHLARECDDAIHPKGCFIHQNAMSPSVLAKQALDVWVPLKREQGLKNPHVVARRGFYLDFDPARDDGISSTPAEHALALERADLAVGVLAEILGDDAPLGYASSGNGAHVHVALDSLPNDQDVETLVRECLQAADALFSDAHVKVDTGVHDARRIAPLYGTMKRKGSDYRPAELPKEQWRPHRRTGFVCRDEVRRLGLYELRRLSEGLKARAGARPVAPAAPAQPGTPTTPTVPAAPSLQPNGPTTPWDVAKAVDIEDVSDWLGLGRGPSMVCPGCASSQGYGRVPGANVTKCHHQRCASHGVPGSPGTRTTIDLVCEVRKVAARQALSILAKQFGFATAQPATRSAARGAAKAAPASTGAPWEQGFLRDDYGQVRSLSANAELILGNDPAWKGVLRFNEIANAVVFGAVPPSGFLPKSIGDEWTEEDDVAAVNWLQRNWLITIGEQTIGGIVTLVAKRDSFDSIRDALKALAWDGTPRVDTWLVRYLGARDSEYVRLVGRWWLLSAVARAFRPGCAVHHALILEGAQGAGKSTLVQILAGENLYLEDVNDIGSVEAAKQLQGKWIVELSELDALRRAEQTTIKRFVSQRTDCFRPSYGRRAQTFQRRCVFIGTTNRSDYLHDATGGRRFWPVKCLHVDLDAMAADRDQLWAEVVALFHQGETWWPRTDEERALCSVEQSDRYDEDVWTRKIAVFVRDKRAVRTHEVLAELNVDVSRMGGENAKRVGAVLLRWGWEQERRREGGIRERLWVRGSKAQAAFDIEQKFRQRPDNVVPFPTGPERLGEGTEGAKSAPPDDGAQQATPDETPGASGASAPDYADLLED